MGLFFTSLSAKESCEHDRNTFRCVKYVKNYDADTITFKIPNVHPLLGDNINIRVNGIDAPEIRTKDNCEKEKAKSAKNIVGILLKNAKRIKLKNIKRGKYFRVVADVIISDKSLADYLLKNGLAYSYHGGRKKKKINWCKSHRETASENKDIQ